MTENLTVEITGLRNRDEADELVEHLTENGIRRDAISVSEADDEQ